ncbi:hypothetical protein MRQ36_31330 [Micromonospora sp. R77]|uniref:hypothetical protein n=1 Tax=Micromonospora sp. R77 TaxID=2925836 RepID=UPI001F611E0B|nr:hypothetical protein [Micromonospora sp. R77]MCI4066814.1 hypothetical protein [Micromonospora sp. R77]
MTGLTRSPRTARGALVGMAPANPLASVVVFQYNPDEMTRRLRARSAGAEAGGSRTEALRLSGAPVEEISLAVEIDAGDQLATGDPPATGLGIYPQLSSLELLLYPRSATVVANSLLARLGSIEIIPPEAPLTMLIWGVRRVLRRSAPTRSPRRRWWAPCRTGSPTGRCRSAASATSARPWRPGRTG